MSKNKLVYYSSYHRIEQTCDLQQISQKQEQLKPAPPPFCRQKGRYLWNQKCQGSEIRYNGSHCKVICSWPVVHHQGQDKNEPDNEKSSEKIKMIHMLTKHGAKWLPKDHSEIGDARRSLLKMRPDYTVEFLWIMSKYDACKHEDIDELITYPLSGTLFQNTRIA